MLAQALLALSLTANARALPPGSLPCDPASFPRPPRVIILGESHGANDDIKSLAERGAAEGRYYLGLEVIGQDRLGLKGPLVDLDRELGASPDTARLFGIEGSPATVFAYIWLVSSSRNSIPSEDDRTFFGEIPKFPLLQEAFRRAAASGLLSPRAVFLARAASAAPSPGDASAPPPFSQPSDVRAMDEAMTQARIQTARLVRETEHDFWVDSIMDQLDANADTADLELGYMLSIRNRDFAREAASLYCSAAAESRDLVLDMGYEHAPGVAALLSAWSQSPLSIRAFNLRDDSREAREFLASLGATP